MSNVVITVEDLKEKIFDGYIKRGFFADYPFKSDKQKMFILNTEELATVFHFPGKTAETPSFERVDSKKSEPPANLPF